jgi:cation-transporting ATPase E
MERYNPNYKDGLNTEQVNTRIAEHLVNYNDQPPTKTVGQIIKSNFFTYFNFLNLFLGGMIIAAGIYGGEIMEALKNCLFMGVIITNSIISIIQEVISKKTIDKLSILAASKVDTIRNSKEELLGIEELVLDDVIKLKIGNQVVTDAVVLDGQVEVNESFITGEADPITKKIGDTLLSGSFIVSGVAYARVDHIGKDNYISKISSEAKYNKKVNSIIMNSFEKILKVLSIVIIPIGVLLFINQMYVTGYDITASTFNTVAALIGMIPEGLLLLTSSVMAVSVIRLAQYKVLVQQLYCIETLARVDVICLDKTGTITEGDMEVYKLISYGNTKQEHLENVLGNIASAFPEKNATLSAISTQYRIKDDFVIKSKIDFSSARKFSAVNFDKEGSYYLGAPEFVLKDNYNKYKDFVTQYSEYRVLVVASNKTKLSENPKDLKVLGFVLIQDKIRKEAPDTLKYFKEQGVKLKIISGDNHETVAKIAKRAGFENPKSFDATELTDDNINSVLEEYDVFGRVTPDQKKDIIEALQKNGHVVAMTGDGVNDVLALKQSDCSIAMASGADAAKNVSQLVLLNSDFSAMPQVVAEGRRTINNIQRSASLLLIKTFFTIILVCICIFMQSEYFYLPIHLTLITACTISIPSFVLALEPNNDRIKGNFMLNVIGKSLPAALTVVFNVVMIVLYKQYFAITNNITQTLIVMMTATTGFIFLTRLCRPFNWLRGTLLVSLVSMFIYVLLFQFDFFDLSQLQVGTLILYIVFAMCSIYVFDKLSLLIDNILKHFDKDYKGLTNAQ